MRNLAIVGTLVAALGCNDQEQPQNPVVDNKPSTEVAISAPPKPPKAPEYTAEQKEVLAAWADFYRVCQKTTFGALFAHGDAACSDMMQNGGMPRKNIVDQTLAEPEKALSAIRAGIAERCKRLRPDALKDLSNVCKSS